MDWIREYQLFLFDFDGLLVNTEEVHFYAYRKACAAYGVDLKWSFEEYCRAANYGSEHLRQNLYGQYPLLRERKLSWDRLYAEKKNMLSQLLLEAPVKTMPGVDVLLTALQDANIKRCVVTHSAQEYLNIVCKKIPILGTIPLWITREHYRHPKPNPTCYLKAIETLWQPQERIIGFEDSPKGMLALLTALRITTTSFKQENERAKAVMVCPNIYPEIPSFILKGAAHYLSLAEVG